MRLVVRPPQSELPPSVWERREKRAAANQDALIRHGVCRHLDLGVCSLWYVRYKCV